MLCEFLVTVWQPVCCQDTFCEEKARSSWLYRVKSWMTCAEVTCWSCLGESRNRLLTVRVSAVIVVLQQEKVICCLHSWVTFPVCHYHIVGDFPHCHMWGIWSHTSLKHKAHYFCGSHNYCSIFKHFFTQADFIISYIENFLRIRSVKTYVNNWLFYHLNLFLFSYFCYDQISTVTWYTWLR